MPALLLNDSLASGLGRPDLALRSQIAGTVQTLQPPVTSPIVGSDNSVQIGLSERGPVITLFLLTGALVAFVWWVHPHLK